MLCNLGRQRRNTAPQRVRQVNTSSSLHVGLEWVLVPAQHSHAAAPLRLPRGRKENLGPATPGAAPTVSMGPFGPARSNAASATLAFDRAGSTRAGYAVTFSMLVVGQHPSAGAASSEVLAGRGSSAGAVAGTWFNTTLSRVFWRTIFGSTYDNNVTVSNGQWFVAIGTADRNFTDKQYAYLGLAGIGETSIAGSLANLPFDGQGVTFYGASRYTASSPVALAALWTRRLLPFEVGQLLVDPWKMLAP